MPSTGSPDEFRGPVVPIAPDPERDRRVEIYRDRERRRAARALDRYIESLQSGEVAVSAVAGERVVELVGDYVVARLTGRWNEVAGDRGCLNGPEHPCPDEPLAPYPHPFVAGDDFLCRGCGGLQSDARHGLHQKADTDCGRDDCPGPGHLFGPRSQCSGRLHQKADYVVPVDTQDDTVLPS